MDRDGRTEQLGANGRREKTWVGEHVIIDGCMFGMRDWTRMVMTAAEGEMIMETYPFYP